MPAKHTAVQNIQYFFACLFFASVNFEVFTLFAHFSVAKLVAILYMAVSLLTPRAGLFNLRHIKDALVPFMFMMVTMFVSSVIHSNDELFDGPLILNFIMMWLLVNHARRDNRVFDKGLLWFAISAGIVGVLFLMGIGVSGEAGERMTMFGDNANAMGIKMVSAILFLVNYCLNHSAEKKLNKVWLLVLIYPMLQLVFATASRTALAILVLGLFAFILLYPTKKIVAKSAALLIGAFVVLMGWQVLQQQEVLMDRVESSVEEGDLSERDEIWDVYMQLVEEHPVLGLGLTGWHSYSMQRFIMVRSPHNVIVEILLKSGYVGFLFFLIFLFVVLYRAYLYYRRKSNMAPLLMSISILAMVLSAQALGVKLFWVIAAYAISYSVIEKTKNQNTDIVYVMDK